MHPWHTLSTGQVLEQLRADPVSGLAVNEAAQRLQHYGPNQLKQPPQPNPFLSRETLGLRRLFACLQTGEWAAQREARVMRPSCGTNP